jgi:hypothetical protein
MSTAVTSRIAFGFALVVTAAGLSSRVEARDFFSTLFGAFTGGAPQVAMPPIQLPFDNNANESRPAAPSRFAGGGAYCVRTCDGRYFPIARVEGESRATVCNSFCPASETKVFYGGSIDGASSENGKSYSDLPNAFRYRKEMVANCTCNGKDSVGLASIKIEDDLTLQKGDIVVGAGGMNPPTGRADRHAATNFTPVSPAVRARPDPLPLVAAE